MTILEHTSSWARVMCLSPLFLIGCRSSLLSLDQPSDTEGDFDSDTSYIFYDSDLLETDETLPFPDKVLWYAYLGSPEDDELTTIGVDADGRVKAVGWSDGEIIAPGGVPPILPWESGTYHFSLQLDRDGAFQWHTFSENLFVEVTSAFDADGNIFAMGRHLVCGHQSCSLHGGRILKTDPNGVTSFFADFRCNDIRLINMGPNRNLYLSGECEGRFYSENRPTSLHAPSDGDDAVLVKISGNGTPVWHTFFGGDGDDKVFDHATDSEGNTVIIGVSNTAWNGPAGESPLCPFTPIRPVFVLKIDTNGQYLWHAFYSEMIVSGVVEVATTGDIVIAGRTNGLWLGPKGEASLSPSSGEQDIYVMRLTSEGQYLWHNYYGGNADTVVDILTFGKTGMIVVGNSENPWTGPNGTPAVIAYAGSTDIYLLKLDPQGVYREHLFLGGDGVDILTTAAKDNEGSIVLGGTVDAPLRMPNEFRPLYPYLFEDSSKNIFIAKLYNDEAFGQK